MKKLNPYLSFAGRTQEALAFYETVFGGTLEVMQVKDTPVCGTMPESEQGKAMHASLSTDHWTIMATDMSMENPEAQPASIGTTWETEEELRAAFDKLVPEGKVTCPVGPAFWGGVFGCVTDKFGITWLMTTG